MSVSDRIALMNAGKLEQVGVPAEIYRQPASRFAAEFMGTTNLLQARAARRSPRRSGCRCGPRRCASPTRRRPAGRGSPATVAQVEMLGPITPLRRHARRRHAAQDGDPRCAASRRAPSATRHVAYEHGAPDGACREARHPTSSACRSRSRRSALLFLGVFLLYPLFNVFGASVLDSEGEPFTLANYAKMLGRPFYRAAIVNTLGIGAAATVITTALAVPLRLRARPPADPRQGRDPGAGRHAAGAAVLRQRLCDRAAARPLRHRHPVAARHRHRLRLDLRRRRHRAGLHADALSLCAAADRRRLQGGRRVDGGGGAEPRLLARAAPCAR